ncbi:hypothetical protein [Bifidobacterium apri]|uniref:Uncharacterized protein n=1 Tax=Bifidobacterium apri TaxID=1769423 RepID=A0A6A2VD40_9BIFI|nr:hypothetical protein [Bifidobacterium apri]KAB8291517.1 hypothetical protein DSM100238_1834 [Bifidobacterium apri]
MSDKVKMSVTCVKCGKHAIDWRDTLEKEHWAQLDERPLCPKCAVENTEIDEYCEITENMKRSLYSVRLSLSLMLAHRLPGGDPMERDDVNEGAAEAFIAVSKAYRAVQNLAGDLHFIQQHNMELSQLLKEAGR